MALFIPGNDLLHHFSSSLHFTSSPLLFNHFTSPLIFSTFSTTSLHNFTSPLLFYYLFHYLSSSLHFTTSLFPISQNYNKLLDPSYTQQMIKFAVRRPLFPALVHNFTSLHLPLLVSIAVYSVCRLVGRLD